jgi:erythronate-4-phosphate dehydrogenase
MRILADANIPSVHELFGGFGETVAVPAVEITASGVRDADVLLVRSVTRVDHSLLADSAVRFVGTATIGHDHIDRDYLASRGIAFADAPGSNAESVVEYLLAAVLAVFADRGLTLRGRTVGIVGCGQIGSRLAARLPALGANVLLNDPPLARASPGRPFVSLDELLAAADVVTLHTPLSHSGPDATEHLVDARALHIMRPGSWLVNTSRGPVVDNAALLGALSDGYLSGAILDVWEGEPQPDPALLARCVIGTPHIAGYSLDGKLQGAAMLAHALADFLGLPRPEPGAPGPRPAPLAVPPAGLDEPAWLDALVRQAYDVRADDARMRTLLRLPESERGAHFTKLRATYPVRRSFGLHRVAGDVPVHFAEAVRSGLRIGTGPPVQLS